MASEYPPNRVFISVEAFTAYRSSGYRYIGEPQCDGVIERFMRTLKEQCLYLHRFQNLEEARRVISEFITRYNSEWLIERLGYRTPAQARAGALRLAA